MFLFSNKPVYSNSGADYSLKFYLFENIPIGNVKEKTAFEMTPIDDNSKLPFVSSLKDYNRQKVFIEMIEKRYFGKNYPRETIENRIKRLEKLVFGTEQVGNINDRYFQLIERIPVNNEM